MQQNSFRQIEKTSNTTLLLLAGESQSFFPCWSVCIVGESSELLSTAGALPMSSLPSQGQCFLAKSAGQQPCSAPQDQRASPGEQGSVLPSPGVGQSHPSSLSPRAQHFWQRRRRRRLLTHCFSHQAGIVSVSVYPPGIATGTCWQHPVVPE